MHSLNIEITPWNHLHLPQFLPKLHLLEERSLQVFLFDVLPFLCFPPSPRRLAKPLCQSTPLVGQDLQPAKKTR